MKMQHILLVGLSLVLLGSAPLTGYSEESDVYPKIGLVLSGGGARGFAHIGALQVLEEIGMPIDCIAGTSMGSIVGGLYAIGYSADEIEKVVTEVDWDALFSDTPPRKLWSYQQKRASSKYMLGVDFSFKEGFLVPRGLTAGQKISNLFAFLTLRVSDIESFDNFPIPYRAVATDIVTGEEVILDHGLLAEAMRASMAVPGAFTPVKLDDHLLVDGGVVKNLPVDVAKRMGADIIVAIDVASPLKSQDQLNNPFTILNQMIGLQILKETEAQRKLADLVVLVDLGKYTSTSFGSGPEIIALGEESTRERLDDLKSLVRTIRKIRPKGRAVPSSVLQEVQNVYIDDVVLEGNAFGKEQVWLKELQEQKGQELNPDLLEHKIEEIFSTGKYETVKFSLAPGQDDRKTLKLQLQEREQGAHVIRVGMNYESRFEDAEEDKMVFLVNTTLRNLTGPGSQCSNELQFVNVLRFETEYFQPLGKGFFVAPFAFTSDDYQILYEDGSSIARYDKNESGVGLRLGTFLSRFGEVSVGYLLERADISPTTAVGDEFPEFDESVSSLIARSRLDLLDTFPFPNSGSMLNIDYQMAHEDLGGEVDFHKLAVEYWNYFSPGDRSTVGLRLNAGTDFKSDVPLYDAFTLGGRDSFVGYKVDEHIGAHLGIAALEYRYRFHELPSAVGGGIFAIATANVGNAWETFEELTEDFSLRYGGSLGVGVDTILGPVRADLSLGDGGRFEAYLNIGYRF